MILKETGFGYNDITIIPAMYSNVNSRSECIATYDNNKLPIFAAPMSSVIDDNNYTKFNEVGVTPVIPRSVNLEKRINLCNQGEWIAVSLNEYKDFIFNSFNDFTIDKIKICIDVANGHMKQIYDLCFKSKHIMHERLSLMVGNIANPHTYMYINSLKDEDGSRLIDYVRCGIGSGAGCITSSNTSIHMPMASLIDDCNRFTKHSDNDTMIIADGGIRNYSDVIKALALGADYVMIGSLFAKCIESCGDKYAYYKSSNDYVFIHDNTLMSYWDNEERGKSFNIVNKFYGMASAQGQIAISGKKTKTSEGITKYLDVIYTLPQWTQNMKDYIKSAMSYCDCFDIKHFIGTQVCIVNSLGEINAVNK